MYVPGFKDEPFEWYRDMRANSPVVRDGTNVYVFRYSDSKAVLNNFRTFSSQFRDFMDPEFAKQLNELSSPSILILDPPRHTKLRNLVNRAFTPKRVASYEGEIRKIARKLLDDAASKGRFDFVREFSYPLPVMVISRILGVPESDMDRFKVWSDKLAEALGRGVDMEVQSEMSKYFSDLIDERKDTFWDDLLSVLMQAEVDGEKLTKQDITGFSILLLAAGNETTTNLMSNAVISMTENRGTFQDLKNGLYNSEKMIEEVLRYRSPVQSTRRVAREDFRIGGVDVKKGDFVSVFLGSANRDEEVFSDPERFIPGRNENRHIAFGEGVHFCLGAPLARLEGRIALEEISNRYGDIRAVNVDPEDRLPSDIMYGYRRLEVEAQ